MNCKSCGQQIGWLNWDGKCFGCYMYGDDRPVKKPKPAPVEKPVVRVLDLFSSAGE